MTLPELLTALDGAGLELDVEIVLDMLWLAQQQRELKLFDAKSSDGAASPEPVVTPGTQRRMRTKKKMQAGNTQIAGHTKSERNVDPPAASDGETSVYSAGEWGEGADTVKASPVAVPAGQALPGRLAFGRAMRPFRRRWASRNETELDEVRTVEMTADRNGELYPVFRPKAERWFDVDVVLEDDPAIRVWEDVMRDFCQMLRDTGAFRDVRRWRLRLDRKPLLETPGGLRCPAGLMTGGSRRLVFFATHGSSPHWENGNYARLLEGWSRSCSLAVLQLQPRHRWKRTPLGEPSGTCVALEPGIPAMQLQAEVHWWSMLAGDDAHSMRIPVTPLDPAALAEFASMQMARASRCPIVVLDASATSADVSEQAENRDAARELALLAEQSPASYRLATYLSAGAFTIPVARLVQEAMFGSAAEQGHLADVLLSGLVTSSAVDPERNDPYMVYYEFTNEAREILMRSLRKEDARNIASSLEERVSKHIKQIYGRAITFQGLVPNEKGNYQLPTWAQPFAKLSLSLLGLPGKGVSPQKLLEEFEAKHPAAVLGRVARFAAANAGRSFRVPDELAGTLEGSGLIHEEPDGLFRFLPGVEARLTALAAGRGLAGVRILWVDDHPSNNEAEAAILRSLGSEIEPALTTQEAISKIESSQYDVIISDMVRGEEKRAAFDLLAALRSHDGAPPLIIFSMHTEPLEALRAGAFGCTNRSDEIQALVEEAVRSVYSPDRSEQARGRRMRAAIRSLGLAELIASLPPAEVAREILFAAADRNPGFLNCLMVVQAYADSSVNQLVMVYPERFSIIADVSDSTGAAEQSEGWRSTISGAARGSVSLRGSEASIPLLTGTTTSGVIYVRTSRRKGLAAAETGWLVAFGHTLARAIAAVERPWIVDHAGNSDITTRIVRDLRIWYGIELRSAQAIPEADRFAAIIVTTSYALFPRPDVVNKARVRNGLWFITFQTSLFFGNTRQSALEKLRDTLLGGGVRPVSQGATAMVAGLQGAESGGESPADWHPPEDIKNRGPLTPCVFTIGTNHQKRGAKRWDTWGDLLVNVGKRADKEFVYLVPSNHAPEMLRNPLYLGKDDTALELKKKLSTRFAETNAGRKMEGLQFRKRMANGTEHLHVYSRDYDEFLTRGIEAPAQRPAAWTYATVPIASRGTTTFFDDPNETNGDFVITRGRHELVLPAEFRMGMHPVTNKQFFEFVQDGGYDDDSLWEKAPRNKLLSQDRRTPGPSTWKSGGAFPDRKANHPVAGINYREARAFVNWLEKRRHEPGWIWALPTEDMWELSARSDAGYAYPWGPEFLEGHCNSAEAGLKGTSDVNEFRRGKSPFGCLDMAGNVWEFVETAGQSLARVCTLMGGSYVNNAREIKAYLRLIQVPAGLRAPDFGFRCAQVRSPVAPAS